MSAHAIFDDQPNVFCVRKALDQRLGSAVTAVIICGYEIDLVFAIEIRELIAKHNRLQRLEGCPNVFICADFGGLKWRKGDLSSLDMSNFKISLVAGQHKLHAKLVIVCFECLRHEIIISSCNPLAVEQVASFAQLTCSPADHVTASGGELCNLLDRVIAREYKPTVFNELLSLSKSYYFLTKDAPPVEIITSNIERSIAGMFSSAAGGIVCTPVFSSQLLREMLVVHKKQAFSLRTRRMSYLGNQEVVSLFDTVCVYDNPHLSNKSDFWIRDGFHQKYIIFYGDDDCNEMSVIFGSPNLTIGGLRSNIEICVRVPYFPNCSYECALPTSSFSQVEPGGVPGIEVLSTKTCQILQSVRNCIIEFIRLAHCGNLKSFTNFDFDLPESISISLSSDLGEYLLVDRGVVCVNFHEILLSVCSSIAETKISYFEQEVYNFLVPAASQYSTVA